MPHDLRGASSFDIVYIMANYLVTGGSGFLGINLIRYLLERGEKVRSLDLQPFDYPEKDGVDHIVGDIRDRDVVDGAMDGIDIVVHCAAALPLYSKEDIYTTNIDGTRIVFESAKRHNVDRVVYISSSAVYGIPKKHPIYEDDPFIGVGPYGKTKVAAEKISQRMRDEGMCISVLRPKSFIGPERLGVFALFYDWAETGHGFPMIGSGNNRYQLMDVSDLCEAIYLSATKEKSVVNDVFNIGAKEFTTMKGDYQVVLDQAGFGKKMVPLPATPIIFILRILEFLKLSPLYKWVYETAAKDSFLSVEKAENILGFTPKYSNKDALLRNYTWYLENKDSFAGGDSGVSHRVPWKQGVLRFAKVFF